MKKKLLLLLLIPFLLFANGEDFFNKKEYKKALPLLEQEAKNGSKTSMYCLANMYQNALGVPQDYKKAAYWYQQSAAAYKQKENDILLTNLHDQTTETIDKKVTEKSLQLIDTNTPETSSYASYLGTNDFFGLKPYDTNFILPVSYSKHKYRRVSAAKNIKNYTANELDKYAYYDSNTEVEFQISLQKNLTYNLFGLDENINVAYTQKVWWQLYSDSGPFRETNYLPEVFINIPLSSEIRDDYGLKSIKSAFLHESNGQEGYRSRSWNRLYTAANWQFDNLFLSTRVWYRLSEDTKYDGYYDGLANPATGEIEQNYAGDDNPNIENYLGYGDIKLNYLYGKAEMGALLRYNFGSGGKNRGAVDLHWSYPFLGSKNTFLYAKFFNGYGESLIDYNNNVTKAAFGFSFSRGAF